MTETSTIHINLEGPITVHQAARTRAHDHSEKSLAQAEQLRSSSRKVPTSVPDIFASIMPAYPRPDTASKEIFAAGDNLLFHPGVSGPIAILSADHADAIVDAYNGFERLKTALEDAVINLDNLVNAYRSGRATGASTTDCIVDEADKLRLVLSATEDEAKDWSC